MMALDLAEARLTWIKAAKDEKERSIREKSDFLAYESNDSVFADFHANRHPFITNLAKSGMSPKLAQTLACHSDIRLTFDIYTHVDQNEQAVAVSTLPRPPKSTGFGPSEDEKSSLGNIPNNTPSIPERAKIETREAMPESLKSAEGTKTFAQTHRSERLLGAADDNCAPKRSIAGVICNDCQQVADIKESGQGRA